jgi:hypothetical protein
LVVHYGTAEVATGSSLSSGKHKQKARLVLFRDVWLKQVIERLYQLAQIFHL